MAESLLSNWLTWALGPSLWAILLTLIIALLAPIFLHQWLYRQNTAKSLPTFLLVGPSGSGKTSLLTLFERGSAAKTHLSQAPLSLEVSLPDSTVAASSRYRSVNDPSNKAHKKLILVDTPGHGKLRHFALNSIINPQNIRGIIFMVDATTLTSNSSDEPEGGLAEAAEYLYDMLMALQKRYTSSKSSKGPAEMPILIAPNKLDLFTALPAKLVKNALESELTMLRNTRSKGLLDSGIGMDDDAADERDTLGGAGEGAFEFGLMEEYNIPVEVIGGNVLGAEGAVVDQWWDWIGNHL